MVAVLDRCAIYPALLAARGRLSDAAIGNVIAASADGYAFPTNLDLDQPIDGMSPQAQAELVALAVGAGYAPEALPDLMAEQSRRRLSR
ncbi:MAG: hypothetical protein L0H25_05795 [Micrococcales bacterium]|nr:hypothetical protein [Micrococcales bacterium]